MKIQEMIEVNGNFYPRVRDATLEEENMVINTPSNDRIANLKQKLLDTDYKAIKYAEGWLTDEEYEPIKLQRQEWREEINKLEVMEAERIAEQYRETKDDMENEDFQEEVTDDEVNESE